MDQARHTALKIIHDIDKNKAYVNIAVNKHLNAGNLKGIDRKFATELVYGVISRKLTLDWIISQYSSIRLKKISLWILNILRLGIYQIIYLDRVPDSAACNESVKLAQKYNSRSSGFVNAILRKVTKEKGDIAYPQREKSFKEYLSVRYSYPLWMVENFLRILGPDDTENFFKICNEKPDLTIRVNTLKILPNELIALLEKNNVKATCGKFISDALLLEDAGDIASLEEYKKGFFQVQDEGSMLVSTILDPQPGEKVLDACSAPGGKTTHIAQRMNNKGLVVARDVYEHKLKLVDESVKRLGISIVRTEMKDALKLDNESVESYDRVLLDAPCSGSGIIRRKPDIKWTRSKEDIGQLIELQKKMIKIVCQYVKPGGILVYSTCSIDPEENEEVVKCFLDGNEKFELVDISKTLPDSLANKTSKPGMITLYPHREGSDGFFICKIKKKDEELV